MVPSAGSTRACGEAEARRLSCTLVTFAGADHLIAYSQIDAIVRRSARWLRREW